MSDAETQAVDAASETPETVIAARGSRDRSDVVAQFVERVIERAQGTFERGVVDADVDPRPCIDVDLTSASLDLGDLGDARRFVYEPGPRLANTRLVTPASEIFHQMVNHVAGFGRTTAIVLAAAHEPRETLPEVEEPDHLDGDPTVESFVGVDVEVAVKVTFVAEERHEELVVVHAPVHGTPEVVETSVVRAAKDAGTTDDATGFEPDPAVVDAALERALTTARDWAHDAARPRQRLILQNLTRELQRLTHYFGELMAENEEEDELREQLAAELDRRVSEEVGKHKLAIEFEPLACAIVGRPVVTFTYTDDDDDRWVYVYDRVSGEVWHETPSVAS